MESKETTGDVQGCLYKPICCWKKEEEEERLCIWHGNLKKAFRQKHRPMIVLDIQVIDKDDFKYLREVQEVIRQVFARKGIKEEDQSNSKIYSLISEYLKKNFDSLWKKCKAWKRYLEIWKHVVKSYGKQDPKYLQQGILKELLIKEDS